MALESLVGEAPRSTLGVIGLYNLDTRDRHLRLVLVRLLDIVAELSRTGWLLKLITNL